MGPYCRCQVTQSVSPAATVMVQGPEGPQGTPFVLTMSKELAFWVNPPELKVMAWTELAPMGTRLLAARLMVTASGVAALLVQIML